MPPAGPPIVRPKPYIASAASRKPSAIVSSTAVAGLMPARANSAAGA
jgi:hypothetical protein